MKNALYVAQKDFLSYFRSWMGIFIFALFLLIAGLFFSLVVMTYAKLSLEASRNGFQDVQGLGLTRFISGSFFVNMAIVLMFLVPILTMRTIAEERKQETLELLFTYPLTDFDIVWGKFLGLVWLFELLFLPTLLYLVLLTKLGAEFDWGPILIGYLGFWMLGNAYLALGLFVSSISENQVVSAVLTFACLAFFWILDWIAMVAEGPLGHFFAALSPLGHYREFTLGVVDLGNVAFFTFFTLYFLFLSLRAIEVRSWKG